MRIILFALMTLIFSFTGMASAGDDAAPSAEKAKIRVGVYDSRAIAVAFTHSKAGQEHFQKQFQQLKKELDAAEAAGDKEKAAQVKAEGQAGQERLHQQGFGTASVKKYLEKVKDKIPEVAKNAGVDLLVSKWDVTYQNPAIEVVDLTDELVKLFEPNERVLKIVQELKKQPPLDAEEIRKIKD